MQYLQRTVLWQNLSEPGTEHCRLRRDESGWLLDGVVLLAHNHDPLRIVYQVRCNVTWVTRTVEVKVTNGVSERLLYLTVDPQLRWWDGNTELTRLRGCHDVDLGITPATNTLPIGRLNLGIGSSREVVAAWIRFPELTIEPLLQRYTRLSENRFHYESRGGAFVTEFEVDDLGLVTRYPGSWERTAIIDSQTPERSL